MQIGFRCRYDVGVKVIDTRHLIKGDAEPIDVFFIDGPCAGQRRVIRRVSRYVVSVLKSIFDADADGFLHRQIAYDITPNTLRVGPYFSKRLYFAMCGSNDGPIYDPDKLREYQASMPWSVEKPLGSRDFEGWWAMRMIELGRANLDRPATWTNWVAVEWLAEMERLDRD